MGGPKDGETVPIPAPYHQGITNGFREQWPYGTGQKPSQEELNRMKDGVYNKFPLPPFDDQGRSRTYPGNNNAVKTAVGVTLGMIVIRVIAGLATPECGGCGALLAP